MELETIIYADESFKEALGGELASTVDYVVGFINKRLAGIGVTLTYKLADWDTSNFGRSSEAYRNNLVQIKPEGVLVFGFTDMQLFNKYYVPEQGKAKIGGRAAVVGYLPMKFWPRTHKYALAKVALHEVGHVLGLKHSYGFNIMNQLFGIVTSKFSKEQNEQMRIMAG